MIKFTEEVVNNLEVLMDKLSDEDLISDFLAVVEAYNEGQRVKLIEWEFLSWSAEVMLYEMQVRGMK